VGVDRCRVLLGEWGGIGWFFDGERDVGGVWGDEVGLGGGEGGRGEIGEGWRIDVCVVG